jgi:hypothetical protein
MGLIPMLLDARREKRAFETLKQSHLREEKEQAMRREEAKRQRESAPMSAFEFERAMANPYKEPDGGPGSNDTSQYQSDTENAYVPLPPASVAAKNQGPQVAMLQRMRDRMAKTRGNLQAGGTFVKNNVRNPFSQYPQLKAGVEGVAVEVEEPPKMSFLPPQNRPRYV